MKNYNKRVVFPPAEQTALFDAMVEGIVSDVATPQLDERIRIKAQHRIAVVKVLLSL